MPTRQRGSRRHGAVAAVSFEDLLHRCDAVAFAVPPAVQAELATAAAIAGKPMLLEKPVAASLSGAERLAKVVAAGSVATMVMLTLRFMARTHEPF